MTENPGLERGSGRSLAGLDCFRFHAFMRVFALVALGLVAAASSAQTALPQFSDYPAGPVYRGRVAPLVVSSSPFARTYRTRTREAMAEGVNFAGHYVVATWGCGTECMNGHIVDARTGRAVADLPFNAIFLNVRPDSRLITVATPDDLAEMIPIDDTGNEGPIPSRYQSSYWVLENGRLRHLGSLLASDIDVIRGGGPTPALRQASPGDVLVPLAVGNTWTYAAADGATVVYRITGPGEQGYGVRAERTRRAGGTEQRTVETWSTDGEVGDGSFYAQTDGDCSSGFAYSFGLPEAEGEGVSVERETVRVGEESREAICYAVEATEYNVDYARPGRTCFVPRIGIVSDDRDGAMTLTSYTLR